MASFSDEDLWLRHQREVRLVLRSDALRAGTWRRHSGYTVAYNWLATCNTAIVVAPKFLLTFIFLTAIVFLMLPVTCLGGGIKHYEIKSPKEFFDKYDVLTTAVDDDQLFDAIPGMSKRARKRQQVQEQANAMRQLGLRAGPRGYPLTATGEIDYGPNVSKVITHIITNKGYDKRIRPNYKGRPVNVGLTLFISGVSSVSEVNMDVTLDFYFRQFWQDPRLAFEGMWDEELVIGGEFMREIWRPDTFFVNAKQAFFHQITMLNTFLRITPYGNVTQSLRLTVTASCPMDFTYFPMDSQRCTLEIESFGYTTRDITYRWAKAPLASVAFAPEVQLPQFRVRGHREVTRHIELSTGNYSRLAVQMVFTRSFGFYIIQVYVPSILIVLLSFVAFWINREAANARVALGNYSRLAVEIYFERSLGYYLIQVYVPSSLIVMLSLVSFWINRESAPARVSLGITTVLTMTTLISSTNASLPKISYLKAIDVYLVSCFIMVFAALLEYAAVTYTGKRCKMLQSKTNRFDDLTGSGGMKRNRSTFSKSNGSRSRPQSESERINPLTGEPIKSTSVHLTNRKAAGGFELDDTRPSLMVSMNESGNGDTKATNRPLGSGFDTEYGAESDTDGAASSTTTNGSATCCDYCRCVDAKASDIEKYSRIVFPTVFACFNILYWITYLNISVVTDEEGFIAAEEA